MASAVDRMKGFAKSCEQRIRAAFQKPPPPPPPPPDDAQRRRDPIEILKRLQRELFTDLMKLRDRQEKVERMLSLYRSGKANPFQEASTRIKGVFNVAGALFFADIDGQQILDTLRNAGIREGIESKFIFETFVRQKDTLIAEFLASDKSFAYYDDLPWNPLVLGKVIYSANVNDWFSVVTSPLGAQCTDFGLCANSLQEQGLHGISSFGPPSFSQYHGCSAGLNVKGPNFTAALAELVSELNLHTRPVRNCLATYGQFSYQLFEGTKVTLSGLWEVPKQPFQKIRIGTLAMPLFSSKHRYSDVLARPSSSSNTLKPKDLVSSESIAFMLEAELDDSTRVGGWCQLEKGCPNCLQWAVSLSDTPEDELGWGLKVGGLVDGHLRRVQFEGFLKLNVEKRFSLQPGIVYAMDGRCQKPIMVLHSSWSF